MIMKNAEEDASMNANADRFLEKTLTANDKHSSKNATFGDEDKNRD